MNVDYIRTYKQAVAENKKMKCQKHYCHGNLSHRSSIMNYCTQCKIRFPSFDVYCTGCNEIEGEFTIGMHMHTSRCHKCSEELDYHDCGKCNSASTIHSSSFTECIDCNISIKNTHIVCHTCLHSEYVFSPNQVAKRCEPCHLIHEEVNKQKLLRKATLMIQDETLIEEIVQNKTKLHTQKLNDDLEKHKAEFKKEQIAKEVEQFETKIKQKYFALLTKHKADFTKEQIANEVEELEKKYQKKANEKGPDCQVCLSNMADAAIIDCGHVVCSKTCLKKIGGQCPFCRGSADRTCKLFFG